MKGQQIEFLLVIFVQNKKVHEGCFVALFIQSMYISGSHVLSNVFYPQNALCLIEINVTITHGRLKTSTKGRYFDHFPIIMPISIICR